MVHAVPVQGSRMFLAAIRDALPASTPLLCVSKGLEVGSTGAPTAFGVWVCVGLCVGWCVFRGVSACAVCRAHK